MLAGASQDARAKVVWMSLGSLTSLGLRRLAACQIAEDIHHALHPLLRPRMRLFHAQTVLTRELEVAAGLNQLDDAAWIDRRILHELQHDALRPGVHFDDAECLRLHAQPMTVHQRTR